MLGPALSQLEIPEPVLENLKQSLEPAYHRIGSGDGEYGGQIQENRESHECHEEYALEQHRYGEDLFADWGGSTEAKQA